MNIYYDMDNCLVLFNKRGHEMESLHKAFSKGYFKKLKPLDDSEIVIPLLQNIGINVCVLSACLPTVYCMEEKEYCLKKYFPTIKKENIFFIPKGMKKSDYVIDIQNSILVDDFGKNLDEWEHAGGIAIKKSSSNKKRKRLTVHNHFEIFDILKKLKIIDEICE